MKFLLHPNKITISKAISLTRYILENEGCEDIPSESTFRRYANHFKDTKFDIWTLIREGEKALNDKVEPYIERDLSKIEVGDVYLLTDTFLVLRSLIRFRESQREQHSLAF